MRNLKIIIFFVTLLFILSSNCLAYVIIAVEQGSAFYDNKNNIEKEKGKNKLYYEIDLQNNTIKRTKVIIMKTGEIIPDDTEYKIISPISQKTIISGEQAIYAIGKPGWNAYELLTISKDSVMSAKSTGDYILIFNSKIIERNNVTE